VYFEGGEPFLFYPLMVEGIRIAREKGFKTGMVTNAYWATTVEDGELWLKSISELDVSNLSISDDAFHYGEEVENTAKCALAAAKAMDVPTGSISIEKPEVKPDPESEDGKGGSIIGGSAVFRGRAVDKLIEGLPRRNWEEFGECPFEDLRAPKRVHLDSFGNVHICQGLSMGNMWETPLSKLVKNYEADAHPICGPIAKGGPTLLAKELKVEHEDEYVDACHFCYALRKSLIDEYPQYLAPRQVYGLE
ncbi:MAG: hypothetical protein KAI64_06970, partial [Thermoplasmata archaeon]|nr:hypothetical protein [Thermoplasmata archaeon]